MSRITTTALLTALSLALAAPGVAQRADAQGQRPTSIPADVLGRLEHVDPGSRTLHFEDGRIVTLEPGATIWVDGRELPIETLRPGMTVVIAGGKPAHARSGQAGTSTPVTAAPAAGVTRLQEHPPVGAWGTVAQVDPQAGVVVFEDGRSLKVGTRGTAWQPIPLDQVRPGDRLFVENAQPTAYQGTTMSDRVRMGRVARVDSTRKMVLLDDGTWVSLQPSTQTMMNGQVVVTELQPGDQIVIFVDEPGAAGTAAPTTSTTITREAPQASALPRQTLQEDLQGASVRADRIHIMRRHQTP